MVAPACHSAPTPPPPAHRSVTTPTPSPATTTTVPSRSVRKTSAPDVRERVQRLRRRVPVVVVLARRGDRDPGPEPPQEVEVLEPAPVVRDLEHVGPQPRPGARQRHLRLGLDVAGQQDADAADRHQQHHRGVVGTVVRRHPRRRPERLQGDVPDDPGGAVRRHHGRVRGLAVHEGGALGGLAHGGHVDLPDPAAGVDARQPVDVVGVEVGEHQQRHLLHVEPVEAAVDQRGIGAGVHDDRAARAGPERERVALADVADREHPAGRRPAGARQRHQHHQPEQQAAGGAGGPSRQQRPQDQREADADHGQQHQRARTGPPVDGRQRQPRAVPGHRDDPGRAEPGTPAQHRSRRRPGQPDEPAEQPEHRRRRDQRRREQVGDHRHQADLAGQPGHHRRADELRGDGYGDRLGRPPGQPAAERLGPRRSEQQDARGGQHAQREAGRDRQPRVPQQQRGDRDTRARAPRGRGRCRRARAARPRPSPPPGPRSARSGPAARSRRSRGPPAGTAPARAPRTTARPAPGSRPPA